MEKSKQETLDRYVTRFQEQWSEADAILPWLKKAGLTLTRCIPEPGAGYGQRCSWFLYATPEIALQQRFDLAPEVLVVISLFPVFQAKNVQLAESYLREDPRLDRGLVLVLTADPQAEDHMRNNLPLERAYIFTSARVAYEAADPQRWLRELLREHLGRRRLFAPGPPVLDWQFIGREGELRDLQRDLLVGRCIGLYGLRKVGKTSLLRRLVAQLREEDHASAPLRALPLYLDLQSVSFNERSFDGVLRALQRAILSQLAPFEARLGGALRASADVVRTVEALIDWGQRQAVPTPLILIFDEYEHLLDGRIRDGLEILSWLRGLLQSHPRSMSLILAGLNRKLASQSRIAERQNPVFGLLLDYPLSGLLAEDTRSLLRRIGRRLSLVFEPAAAELIFAETGGHPYLVRILGDLIDMEVLQQERTPKKVTEELLRSYLPRFRRDQEATMQELLDAARDMSPSTAEEHLVALAHGRAAATAATASLDDQLVRYGILEAQTNRIRIGCFAAWLRENFALAGAHA